MQTTTVSERILKKNVQPYTPKEAVLSLRFDSIETEKRIYILNYKVVFTVMEEKKNFIAFENQVLDIYASGRDEKEAQEDIFNQFDYTYRRLNEFDDNQLSKPLLDAKKYINIIVNSVKEK